MDILQEFNKFDGWKNLTYESQQLLVENSIYNHYVSESNLYLESSLNPFIYLIVSGYVVLYKLSLDGKEKYLYYLSVGDLLNEYAIDGKVTTTSAKALANSGIISIHRDILLDLMEKDFNLCSLVLNSLTLKVRRSQRQILNLGVYNTSQRTISKLLKLSRDYGRKIDGYTLIDAPLNQTDLSNMVGASREAINRCLKELESRGIIFFIGHKIAIPDREKLLNEML